MAERLRDDTGWPYWSTMQYPPGWRDEDAPDREADREGYAAFCRKRSAAAPQGWVIERIRQQRQARRAKVRAEWIAAGAPDLDAPPDIGT